MSWSRNEVTVLIEEYQKYPCLYNVKDPKYKNKHARLAALNKILSEVRNLKHDVQLNDLKLKFHALKTTFLNENRKAEASRRSGAGEEEVYCPSLWYYGKMYFVLAHGRASESVDSYNPESSLHENEDSMQTELSSDTSQIEIEEVPFSENVELETLEVEEIAGDAVENEPGSSGNREKRKKAEPLSEITGAVKKLATAICERRSGDKPEKHKYLDLTNFIGSKMSQMDDDVAEEVEEKIIKLLYEGIKETKAKRSK